MKIRKRLQINVVVFSIIAFCIGCLLVLSLYRLHEANKSAIIAGEIVTSVLERISHRNNYIQNNSQGAKDQWYGEQHQIKVLIKSAQNSFYLEKYINVLNALIDDEESLEFIFSNFVASRSNRELALHFTGYLSNVEEEVLSKMNMKVDEITIHARSLREMSDEGRASALKLAGWSIILAFVVIMTAMIRVWFMSKGIIHRANQLRDIAALINSGNLVPQIDVKGNDEIAEIARAFNDMTVRLKGSYQALEKKIEEQKQAEKALLESERRFRSLIMASNDIIYQMNPDWSEMHRLSGGNFLTDTIETNTNWLQEYIHPDDQSRVTAAINEAVMTKSIFDFEHRVLRADGTLGWISSRAVPLLDSDGHIIEWFGAASDITVRKKAEDALQALNDELEKRVEQGTLELQETYRQYLHAEKLSAVGKLSASIAHEFNNPLQGIYTIVKGIKRRAIMEEEDKELLDLAISETERMKNLIISLRDFHKPSAGKKEKMDVHGALDSLLLLYKSDFKRKKISTVRKYADGLPLITVVPDQLKQVFLNLLNNATDACSEKGGVVTITTYHDNQKVAIAIQDSGVGLSDDERNKIFEPFYTTKPKEKGTGLGLSICQEIIQHHQGKIRVESQPGKGSTFTILLPVI
ncbi:MAG: ATP-binding protein [Desulforhopalus sp.]